MSKEGAVPVANAVDRLAREYLDLTFDFSPMAATSYGVHDFDGLLDDLTEANLDKWVRKLAGIDRRLQTLAPGDPEEIADRDALAAPVAEDLFIEEVEHTWRRNPFEAAASRAAAALREFASWLEGDLAEGFPGEAPFAVGEQAEARKLREAHCFETTPAEFVAIGEAQIAEISAKLSEQAAS